MFLIVVSSSLPGLAASSRCDLLKESAPNSGELTESVDLIVIGKADRKMILFKGKKALKQYHVSLGFSPEGRKIQEGDGKTPEGSYKVEYTVENSAYHKALKVSYPEKADVERAERLQVKPGGNIMIHGFPNNPEENALAQMLHTAAANWTQGCVAVTDSEIDELFAKVKEDTPIEICP